MESVLTQDKINDLRDWALDDARLTFTNKQLVYWCQEVPVDDPPKPQQLWLQQWLNDSEDGGKWPNEAEWTIYGIAYQDCLRRALYKLNHLWANYIEATKRYTDLDEVCNNIVSECLTAMEEA